MEEREYQIIWTVRARRQITGVLNFIGKDSVQNAIKVVDDIVKIINRLTNAPEIYSLDKYKSRNDGTYRAFEKHRYRISYRIEENVIRILRVRHTSMKTLLY
jgi:plasmid stabilization system protein ParE